MPSSSVNDALLRIEHKLDNLIQSLGVVVTAMNAPGNTCSACNVPVVYSLDIVNGLVDRKCMCSTGKVAMAIPPTPLPVPKNQGGQDAGIGAFEPADVSPGGSKDGNSRKVR